MIDERGVMNELLDGLLVFHGEASAALGRVYARLPLSEELAGCKLTGWVVGPRCRWAKTLPATSQLNETQCDVPGSLLAEAAVPDPCFWSDEVPMLYDVEVELRRGGEVIASAKRTVGFRGVGRRGRSLFRQGKRWVPRGMRVDSVVADERGNIELWRAAPAVMVGDRPSDWVCLAASQTGVWVVADLCGVGIEDRGSRVERITGMHEDCIERELFRLSRHAAVFLAVLPKGMTVTRAMRAAAPNLLLAERDGDGGNCAWICAEELTEGRTTLNSLDYPLVIERRLSVMMELAAARAECDRLQRDLAGIGDFAGYFV